MIIQYFKRGTEVFYGEYTKGNWAGIIGKTVLIAIFYKCKELGKSRNRALYTAFGKNEKIVHATRNATRKI